LTYPTQDIGSVGYWEALRRVAEPLELMKFTLIYDGDLPAGDSSRAVYASKIRNELHHQMADLCDSHVVFRALRNTARTPTIMREAPMWPKPPFKLPEFDGPILPLEPGQQDLCEPILIPKVGHFFPLIRHSLYLACAVDVLFLRHEEPFKLLKEGGDLDNRVKILFDGLKMPDPKHEYAGELPSADPLYVVMEDDALISDLSIKSGRLLGNRTKDKHAVRLTIDITIKVLRVIRQNQTLLGG
jgi:hypothetical protein